MSRGESLPRPRRRCAVQPRRWPMLCTFRLRLLKCLVCPLLLGVALGAAAAGPKAYVGNFKDNTVSVIDTGTGTVVATLPVATGPHGMSVTPDGRTVYISGDG